jgi:hypothetical protein
MNEQRRLKQALITRQGWNGRDGAEIIRKILFPATNSEFGYDYICGLTSFNGTSRMSGRRPGTALNTAVATRELSNDKTVCSLLVFIIPKIVQVR